MQKVTKTETVEVPPDYNELRLKFSRAQDIILDMRYIKPSRPLVRGGKYLLARTWWSLASDELKHAYMLEF